MTTTGTNVWARPGSARRIVATVALALLLGAATHLTAADDVGVVKVGAGGYLTTLPQPCKPLPEKIYRTDNVKGPMPTNQWWSSLAWQQFAQPMFAHPLVVRCTAKGVVVSYPGGVVRGGAGGISGEAGGKDGDLVLGNSNAPAFGEALCDGWSDWFVAASMRAGDASIRASFGHGSPFVYCLYAGGNPTVTFAKPPQVWAGADQGAGDAVLGVTVNGHHYGLFGATGSKWDGLGSATLTNNANAKEYFSIAILPDNKPQTLALFKKYAYSHVTDTRLDAKVDGGFVRSTYSFTVKPYEGDETGTIFALYPHQWKYTTTPLTDMTYGSVRGTMKVCEGKGFATAVPIQGVLPMFPPEGIADKARMLGYLKEEAAKLTARRPGGAEDFGDTYWAGKQLGRLATLSGTAEAAGEPELQKVFVGEIARKLENWFTAAPGKDKPVFYYNATWGTLVGSKPSYGSDRPLNDHHFHYGYFIRAAAEVARVDPAWTKKWGPMVNLLIRDIASPDRPDRADPLFPYLRCFDKYAGHSWASGDANFPDGNNQESSSEAMNAWYGVTLWGQATGDTATRDVGLFLFNTERTAVEEYWFDVAGTNFPRDFPNVAMGMVWGAKGAFATWFSGDIDCIHGINWLPFTPGSLYLGRFPDYVKKNYDRVMEKRKAGKNYNAGWGDLVAMYSALQDPAGAAAFIDATPNCTIEAGNSHAFMYHWIYTLRNLGLDDASVTADYPIFAVFKKDGVRTYAVYNYQPMPLTVTFSDGRKVTAKANALTVEKSTGP